MCGISIMLLNLYFAEYFLQSYEIMMHKKNEFFLQSILHTTGFILEDDFFLHKLIFIFNFVSFSFIKFIKCIDKLYWFTHSFLTV